MTDRALVARAVPFLTKAARAGGRPTYSELATHLGGVQPRNLDSLVLVYIRDEICAEHGYPPLTAIVVNKARRRPGDGFWRPWPDYQPDDRKRVWAEMCREVFAFDWSELEHRYE